MYYDYVQKHKIKIFQAEKIGKILNVPNILLNVSAFTQLNDSTLTLNLISRVYIKRS